MKIIDSVIHKSYNTGQKYVLITAKSLWRFEKIMFEYAIAATNGDLTFNGINYDPGEWAIR